MREEISEPQHWRVNSTRKQAWSSRNRTHDHVELAADAVDAALAEVAVEAPSKEQVATSDIVTSLASQLDLLEQQREQLQRLLEQAQAKS